MNPLSRKETQVLIEDFFSNVENKSPSEIKKIVRAAMKEKIKLGDKRKLFCKKCFSPYKNAKTRINKGIKSIECKDCGYESRWKIKLS